MASRKEWRRSDASRVNQVDQAWLTVNRALRKQRRKVRDRWS